MPRKAKSIAVKGAGPPTKALSDPHAAVEASAEGPVREIIFMEQKAMPTRPLPPDPYLAEPVKRKKALPSSE